ncbi:MAG: glutamate racemase [Bacteroidaceae bacterium]|jgi:glutamate racemase|nr:glutamate racemase [Bacteroidaceae bacterium]
MANDYTLFNLEAGPIGVFDSGYGGLTILNEIRKEMPQYDYIYLGDNARAPYGTRSFDVVYEFTVQAVEKLFKLGCPLVILGCNTASAKALRSVQRYYLPKYAPDRRVLGVIIPTAEVVGQLSRNQHIGVLATSGTISSDSYTMEIVKQSPKAVVTGLACPMWVPIIENGEADKPGADYFVKDSIDKLMALDPEIDTVILGCTHFPLLMDKIKKYIPEHVKIVPQGKYIARSLQDYLRRHYEMREKITMNGTCTYYTTESAEKFQESAALFLNEDAKNLEVKRINLRGMI